MKTIAQIVLDELQILKYRVRGINIEQIDSDLKRVAEAISSKISKREKLRLLLEGENGFYRTYYHATQYGSIDDLCKVIDNTINDIFNLFKEN